MKVQPVNTNALHFYTINFKTCNCVSKHLILKSTAVLGKYLNANHFVQSAKKIINLQVTIYIWLYDMDFAVYF